MNTAETLQHFRARHRAACIALRAARLAGRAQDEAEAVREHDAAARLLFTATRGLIVSLRVRKILYC